MRFSHHQGMGVGVSVGVRAMAFNGLAWASVLQDDGIAFACGVKELALHSSRTDSVDVLPGLADGVYAGYAG